MTTENPKKTPFKLKDIYSPALLSEFARSVQKSWSPFPVTEFQDRVFNREWEVLELKERMRHISSCLQVTLPRDYPGALDILVRTTNNYIAEKGEKMVFEYGFLPDFVERFGLDHPEISIPALAQMTRWTSAEFAVRPYLLQYPERMYDQMLEWSNDASFCVRRLSTEGFRPRLPWGMGVPELKKKPELILPVLENLKHDPAETVRRSVANNLNDISKDHPDLALQIAEKWQGLHPDTDWIVRHACRGLLKKGHPKALQLFGFNPDLDTISVADLRHDPEVKIGDRFYFDFSVQNRGKREAMIRLEYAIDYQTLSGKISRKVFKISEFPLKPGDSRSFSKNQRFEDFTTRKHHPGQHRIGILVNGRGVAQGDFEVLK